MADRDLYPPVGFHFKVSFNLSEVSGEDRECRFRDVSGLSKELQTEEYPEGGENRFAHRFPTRAKYGNLVLGRGVLHSSKLVEWCFDAIDHMDVRPVDVTVTLLNESHDPLVRWEFVGAYPVKWSASDLKAEENSLVVETLELAYRHHYRADEGRG